MFVMFERASRSATSGSIASERVPDGSCQLMLSSRPESSRQNATIQSFWMIAVRSWNGKLPAPYVSHVVLDLVDHFHRIARDPERRPHVRRRTVRALVRTAAGREDRDREARRVHAADEAVVVISRDREVLPRRPGDRRRRRPRRRPLRLTMIRPSRERRCRRLRRAGGRSRARRPARPPSPRPRRERARRPPTSAGKTPAAR